MTLNLKLVAKPPNSKFSDGPKDKVKIVRSVILHTANKIAKEIRTRGRADIKAGGNFKKNFIKAFFSMKLRKSLTGGSVSIVRVGSHVPFFGIYEYGGEIVGHPLLWIPIGDAALPHASKYEKTFKTKLVKIISKKGVPLLVVNPNSKKGIKGELLYFGVKSVHEKKIFHIREIANSESARVSEYYRGFMSSELSK